jgi:hypothetical protein
MGQRPESGTPPPSARRTGVLTAAGTASQTPGQIVVVVLFIGWTNAREPGIRERMTRISR